MILYLHGFRSSPSSMKARLMAGRMHALGRGAEWVCPQLPASPKEAIALAQSLVHGVPAGELAIVGSSLGGYYATWLAEHIGCRAVLLNPAIVPLQDLDRHVGISTQFHSDQPFEFKREYIDELRALAVPRISQPQRYFLIAATGDEVLDYRDMVAHYAGASQHVIDGSDHGIAEFADYLDPVLAFCGIESSV
ncbi:YqiA/YcfP family alpha/beta fold hydrolase [Janthinobacterium agaricidamnosum]|uniref:Uncharacterized family protein n=1 Tax=Janthinobacterium agaricidamnosum NBRC 102515 = DSM 9628 TaxID=1349767 RepID=W0V2A6_9BURK|nr:YqiA/YcfP family alpha/beta fold hydrolase [Janthinobacterium agaricidamnosum]CDG81412.1 uncharacterised family protein [Janthinobacterium agaricidamnosum NBRC 102515 = DSM 9628]